MASFEEGSFTVRRARAEEALRGCHPQTSVEKKFGEDAVAATLLWDRYLRTSVLKQQRLFAQSELHSDQPIGDDE